MERWRLSNPVRGGCEEPPRNTVLIAVLEVNQLSTYNFYSQIQLLLDIVRGFTLMKADFDSTRQLLLSYIFTSTPSCSICTTYSMIFFSAQTYPTFFALILSLYTPSDVLLGLRGEIPSLSIRKPTRSNSSRTDSKRSLVTVMRKPRLEELRTHHTADLTYEALEGEREGYAGFADECCTAPWWGGVLVRQQRYAL